MSETPKFAREFDLFGDSAPKLNGIRVLLIYPPVRLTQKPLFPPIGILSLAAVLEKAGANVDVLDLNMLRIGFADLKNELRSRKFDVVGLGGMATVYYYMKFLVGYLKSEFPDVPIIGGGTACSGSPDLIINKTKMDVLVIGEGEPVIIDVVDALVNKKELNNIEGIVFKSADGTVIKTNPRPRMSNLDDLPYPAYHLINLEKYISESFVYKKKKNAVSEARIHELNLDRNKANRPVMLFTKRGCPFQCNFCYRNFGRKVLGQSVQYTLDHMSFLEKNYNTINFSIEDETFNVDRKWVMEFCDALIREKRNYIIGIGNGLRANLIDEEMVRRMKEAGFCSIGVGIESFHEPTLKDMNKLQTAEVITNAIQIINNNGFHLASAQFLFGYPSDGPESMKINVQKCKELGLVNAGFAIPCPYPGTILYEKARQNNLITDEEEWLMELADKDISDRVINMSGKTDATLKKLIYKGEDEIRMYFMRKKFPISGSILTVLQKAGRLVNINMFEKTKGIKDGIKNLLIYHKLPGRLLKSGGANDVHIKHEVFEILGRKER